jgi:hypothetical protein
MSTAPSVARALQPPKFLDRLRTALLMRGLQPEVMEAWVGWTRTFIRFHHLRHPETMGPLRHSWIPARTKKYPRGRLSLRRGALPPRVRCRFQGRLPKAHYDGPEHPTLPMPDP